MGLRGRYNKEDARRLQELRALAYERELGSQLAVLAGAFERWKAREIDAFVLSDAVHAFHQGPSRRLFWKYDDASSLDEDWLVAMALRDGLLTSEEVGEGLLAQLPSVRVPELEDD